MRTKRKRNRRVLDTIYRALAGGASKGTSELTLETKAGGSRRVIGRPYSTSSGAPTVAAPPPGSGPVSSFGLGPTARET